MALSRLLNVSWNRFQDGVKILLKAVGLNAVNSIIRSLQYTATGKTCEEHTKIAIRKSRTIALLRAVIHIVPVSVALWEISLNLSTYYVGATIQSQAYYQFAAKVHEMSAQASLAAIVFSYVSHEMSLGQGLPFGALFSGLQVSQPSYLWSMELWGSICSQYIPLERRVVMVAVTSLAVMLSATVGPSSAILLIPRLGYWPAGSTDIWINSTSQDLWPDRVDGSNVPTSCLAVDAMSEANICPSSQWQAIQTYLDFTNEMAPVVLQDYTPASVEVTGKHSFRRLVISRQPPVNPPSGNLSVPFYDPLIAIATSQQAAVADALTATGTWWQLGLPNITTGGHGTVDAQRLLDAEHRITADYYQPYTIASCENDVIMGDDDHTSVAFPSPPGTTQQMLNTTTYDDSILTVDALHVHGFEFPALTKRQILNTPGPLDQSRLRWVGLPQDPFNGTAIGAVILLPRSPKNITQEIIMCSVGAGWGSSTLNVSTLPGATGAVLSQVNVDDAAARRMSEGLSDAESDIVGNLGGYFLLPYYPQRPVILTEDWAKFLNPSLRDAKTTVFNTLMKSNFTESDPAVTARVVLAGLVANGLSRIGFTSQLQGRVNTTQEPDGIIAPIDMSYWYSGKGNIFEVDPGESEDWVKLRVFSSVEGYAYNATGFTPKLAIFILLTYCLFAILHTVYIVFSGFSSSCWDSIAEVTALAVNSTPTTALRNTCAGITEINIFKLPVRILAAPGADGRGDHLELVFGNSYEKMAEHSTIEANNLYGTMASRVAHPKFE